MDAQTTSRKRSPRSTFKAPVLSLVPPIAPLPVHAQHVASVLADARQKALAGEIEGAVVVIFHNNSWQATIAGSLIGDQAKLCSIAGGLLGNFSISR
jgi:hypothetical protein